MLAVIVAVAAAAAQVATARDGDLLLGGGRVAALGDFDGDKLTDFFVIAPDGASVAVHLFHRGVEGEPQAVVLTSTAVQVAPHDFDRDGMMDLLVVERNPETLAHTLSFFRGDHHTLEKVNVLDVMATDQVLVFDADGDLDLDLFGARSDTRERTVWENEGDFQFVARRQRLAATSGPELASPHSNAFVDLNGDCMADLVVTSMTGCNADGVCHKQAEIWLNVKQGEDGSFVHVKNIDLPRGAQQLSFGDVDRDGAMDIVFPDCWPVGSCAEVSAVQIVFNDQLGLCSLGGSGRNCRDGGALCRADPDFRLGAPVTDPENGLSVKTPLSHTLVPRHQDYAPMLRLGDWDLDGFPDATVTVRRPDDNVAVVAILENVRCTKGLCNDAAMARDRRTFRVSTLIDDLPFAYAGFFADMNEEGKTDLLVLSDPAVYRQVTPTAQMHIVRAGHHDAYFLKALGLNGVKSNRPYGVNMPGVTFKFIVTELDGSRHARLGTQLTQSGYHALETPYNLFGVGRTSNYIEEFFMGLPAAQSKHWSSWICIIPNSQLVGTPHPTDSPSEWQLELFISPAGIIPYVILAGVMCLMTAGLVVLYFTYKERREDERERRAMAHLFSFDAL